MLQCPSLWCWLVGVLSEVGVRGSCLAPPFVYKSWLAAVVVQWNLLVLCCNNIFKITGMVFWWLSWLPPSLFFLVQMQTTARKTLRSLVSVCCYSNVSHILLDTSLPQPPKEKLKNGRVFCNLSPGLKVFVFHLV